MAVVESAQVLTTHKAVAALVDCYLKRGTPVYLDTETTGLNPRRNKLVAVQLYQEPGQSAAILDWRHMRPATQGLVRAELNALFAKLLVVGHNLKFDLNFLHYNGMFLKQLHDTLLAEQVLVGMGVQEGVSFTLPDVVFTYHKGLRLSKAERSWFFKPAPLDERPEEWAAPFPEEEVRYMALDVTVLPAVYRHQTQQLAEQPKLANLLSLEHRVLPALAEMERTGVRIDVAAWRAFIGEKAEEAEALRGELLADVAAPMLQARLARYDAAHAVLEQWEDEREAEESALREEYERIANASFPGWGEYKKRHMAAWREQHPRPETPKQDTTLPNVNSGDQLLDAFTLLGLPIPTKKGKPTLDSKALALYEADYPTIGKLRRYRRAEKFVIAFGEELLAKAEMEADEVHGRIHPTTKSIGAATGRMSMHDPNWQQVPSKGDGKRLRQLVVPAEGKKLVVADFSNIELRILAALSQDETLIRMFAEGLDVHSEMAYRVFGLSREVDVKTAQFVDGWTYRDTIKTVNYGLVYGMSAKRLSRTIRVPEVDAEGIMDSYFAALPRVRGWLDKAAKTALSTGASWTLGGRRRCYPAPETAYQRGRVERQGGNSPIQGTSADITKLATALYHEDGSRLGQLVLVVHDELGTEVHTAWSEDEAVVLTDCMDRAQRTLIGKRLPPEALPRPEAKVADWWCH